jgi:hypothetical protein
VAVGAAMACVRMRVCVCVCGFVDVWMCVFTCVCGYEAILEDAESEEGESRLLLKASQDLFCCTTTLRLSSDACAV